VISLRTANTHYYNLHLLISVRNVSEASLNLNHNLPTDDSNSALNNNLTIIPNSEREVSTDAVSVPIFQIESDPRIETLITQVSKLTAETESKFDNDF
jgi:hypothetical protein